MCMTYIHCVWVWMIGKKGWVNVRGCGCKMRFQLTLSITMLNYLVK